MEQVVILTQAEYKALNDNITDLYERLKAKDEAANNQVADIHLLNEVSICADIIEGLNNDIDELEGFLEEERCAVYDLQEEVKELNGIINSIRATVKL